MQPLMFSVVEGIESKPVTPDIVWILFVRYTSRVWVSSSGRAGRALALPAGDVMFSSDFPGL